MIDITFENDIGCFSLGGGDYPGLRIYTVTGLGFLASERTTKVYNGSYGIRCEARHLPGRTITISGEINFDFLNGLKTKQSMLEILTMPGVLTISNGFKKRSIGAEAIQLDFGEKNAVLQKFTLQFACDEAVFHSTQVISQYICTITNNIKGSFSFPFVFSTRHDNLTLNNTGHYSTFPIVTIYDAGSRVIDDYTDKIIINNVTTCKKLEILTTTSANEILTVDIAQRRITSTTVEGDLYCFSDDTVLADFYLARGNNIITVTNYTNRNITCIIKYYELFSECEVV